MLIATANIGKNSQRWPLSDAKNVLFFVSRVSVSVRACSPRQNKGGGLTLKSRCLSNVKPPRLRRNADAFTAQSRNPCLAALSQGLPVLAFPLVYTYSLGDTPNCFLKLVEKWLGVLKPVMSATSLMVYLPSLISSAARLSL